MQILVINSGSSSIKYQLFSGPELSEQLAGRVERIGDERSRLEQSWTGADGAERRIATDAAIADHRHGMERVFELLAEASIRVSELDAVGHRVVHGGEKYRAAVVVDQDVERTIAELVSLAPLHNPASLTGIRVVAGFLPGVPQIAVFDTAFHQTMPPEAYLYAVPRDWYCRFGVRRYGFHGSSHRYVTSQAAAFLGKSPESTSLISLHLGNGASAAAIRDGQSVDTSMGMTPLEGLVMGTRGGDIDPSVPFFLHRAAGLDFDELESALNGESGLAGLTGVSDMRDVMAQCKNGDEWARRAVALYAYRIRKYVGAYLAIAGPVDAIVFTGGVGENNAVIRAACCEGLSHLGIELDADLNAAAEGDLCAVHKAGASPAILVIRTNEELQIAREVLALL